MRIAVLILGILGVILGFLVSAISVALPEITSNRVDMEEAMIGIVIGAIIIVISFLIAVVGLVLVIMNRKNK